jgi:hypothetical protein
LGFELAPAGKAIVAGDEKLCRGEFCFRIVRAENFEALLGLVLQVLEVWLSGELAVGARGGGGAFGAHKGPSFLMPSVRGLGQEVRLAMSSDAAG